ncbi:hypothetical protein B9Z19DRAFT_1189016 [Tuber borchii]|uniref:Uncharacterized protein n=1 Tax=Tuber borchii TaxID=42251 RepID=A0A2T7A919_TUBBO|nr:hypothetical protein B9Z19DRAFT_1189016 [Tuber borchii]
MSEPLVFASACAGVISLSGTILSLPITLSEAIELLRARWEMNVRFNVLLASDNDLLDYHSRHMAGCSMTGVAAALVAQVTNPSLQQEYIPTIHWIVPALWTSMLVFALLSMYYSFLLHYYLGGFASAGDLRKAFTHRNLSSVAAREEEGEGEHGRGLPSLMVVLLEDFANLRWYKEGLFFHSHHGMHGRPHITSAGKEGSNRSEDTFDTSSTIPEPPKARVRDVESLGSMRGEKEVGRGVIVETADTHQRASPASTNVARYHIMVRE